MRYNIILTAFLLALGFSSCENFLDEYPSTNENKPIETTEDLNLMLNWPIDYVGEANYAAMCATDNSAVDVFHYGFQPNVYNNNSALGWFLWDDYIQINSNYHQDWNNEFGKIGKANLVLDFLDEVTGTKTEKDELRREAHFIRAYSYLNLATVYCMTYSEANFNELGLPLKRSTSIEESVKRATLKETFDFIESDLEIALGTTQKELNPSPWRYSLPAVHAFAARLYLYMGDYDKALSYADKALQAHDALVNFNTVMYDANGKLFNWSNKGALYPQARTMTGPDLYKWAELYYVRITGQRTYYIHAYPSDKLLALYNTSDIRYDAMMVEGVVIGTARSPYVGYFYLGANNIPSGPTTAEMLLIRAECYARKGDVAGTSSNVERLRQTRFITGKYVALDYPSGQKELTQLVIDERCREFPFTLRWFDLHRINRDPLLDHVTITREFYQMDGNLPLTDAPLKTYTLEPGSRRYAMPITESEIISSGKVIEQNKY